MKRDTISAVVSVAVIALSSALGVASLGRTADENIPENNTQIMNETSVLFTETGTASAVIYTFPQTSVVSTVTVTAAKTVTSVTSEGTTVAETSSETTTSVQTEPPVTEVPVTEEIKTEPPQVQETEPAPQPPPEPPAVTEAETEKTDEIFIPESATEFQREVLRLVNEKRAELGIKMLSGSEGLNRAADIRAEEIFRNFDHVRPDGSGWYTIYAEVGVAPGYMGENIAAGRSTPAEVFDQWMNSPDHYANMISENYTYMGVGYFETDSEYHHYWVQLFS